METPAIERLGRHGARLKDLRRRTKKRRKGEVIIDGRRLVTDLVRWGVPIFELYLTPEVAAGKESEAWIQTAGSTFEVDAAVLADLAPTRSPQGVLAVAEEPTGSSWSADAGIALWLDRIQDPGNLGGIVRAAAGLGGSAVLLSPDCTDPFGAAAVRGAAGAVFRIPLERNIEAEDAVARSRSAGGEVWASGSDGRPVAAWRPAEPCLILVGAEGAGLDPSASALADGTVTVPMDRDIESLNVAVATGILLQHLRR
jgi:TrmH family RNA methyltransferase